MPAARGILCLTILTLVVAPPPALAWTVEEHRLLADSALTRACAGWPTQDEWVLRALAGLQSEPGVGSYLDALGFGAVSAWSARDDRGMARRHERGRTVLEQLRPLSAARLDSLARLAAQGDPLLFGASGSRAAARLSRLALPNPVACFLQHHVIALRLAARAGEEARSRDRGAPPGPMFRRALVYEAIAQGYLADAFAAGHLMTPDGARPTGVESGNLRSAHDGVSNLGAYVMNARGETWQTFGDQLLLWYGPSFAHVFEASVTSLRELLLVFSIARGQAPPAPLAAWADSVAREHGSSRERLAAAWTASQAGPDHLASARLPSLMLIPTPIVATWSVRTSSLDDHGMRRRRHYPQLADRGGHDPTLERRDIARLPRRSAVPSWMVPDTLFRSDPVDLVRRHPDFASVRFAQAPDPPPSYAGVILVAAAARQVSAGGRGLSHELGVGYGLVGESPLVVDRLSVHLLTLIPERAGRPRAVGFMVGGSPTLPNMGIWRHWSMRWVGSVRFEAGHTWTRGPGPDADGSRYGLGLESPTIPLKLAYVGLSVRIMQHWTRLDRERRDLALELVLQ